MDHNKIISSIAKEVLSPLGLKRQGKRFWYDDHGWFAIVVEFQPGSSDKGSYLNVGISFMFYENAFWTFDLGYREGSFVSAKSEDQFTGAFRRMVDAAARSVIRYRELAASPVELSDAITKPLTHPGDWGHYHAGILAGLAGRIEDARFHLSLLAQVPCTYAWEHGRRIRCLELLQRLDAPERFRESLLGIVMRCRAARLPAVDSNLTQLP